MKDKKRFSFTVLTILFAAIFFCSNANGGFVLCDANKIQGGGVVKEKGGKGVKVKIKWTDQYGHEILETGVKTIGDDGFVEFKAPLKDFVTGKYVCDFNQYAILLNAGEVSWLEAVAFEPSGDDFLVTPFPDYIRENLGYYVELRIPDLYADTDGSGELGEGDVLYSAVNLADYLPAGVDFQIDDIFSISNGTISSLPGFLFGTEPILRDASSPNGFVNPSPFTGTAYALTEHDVYTVPEPATFLLLGLGGSLLLRRRKVQC